MSSNGIYTDFLAGCLGGAAGCVAGHPLDTVKVRLQTHPPGTYRGIIHCCTQIVRGEGVRSFYKGMSSPLSSLAFVNAIVFGVHGAVVKQFNDQQSLITHFAAGAAAGSAQSIVSGPTELLKLRVQLAAESGVRVYRSPLHCLRVILAESGPRTLLRGQLATHLRDAPGIGVYFAAYEYFARSMSVDGSMEALTSWQLLTAGGAAGVMSWLFNYPTDVIKTRMQASEKPISYAKLMRATYAEGGTRSFFTGMSTALIRAFPTNAATFFTVEWTYRLLIKLQTIADTPAPSPLSSPPPVAKIVRHTDGAIASRYLSHNSFWLLYSFLLPEAGGTFIEPMLRLSL